MNDWELTKEARSQIRESLFHLDPTPSADRDIALIKFGEGAGQKKIVEWLYSGISLEDWERCIKTLFSEQELHKGLGLT